MTHRVWPAALDATLVTAFAAIGRRSHDDVNTIVGIASTAAPFLVGLAAGWVIARAWNEPTSPRTGLLIWPTTIVVGMLVRRLTGDGTAASFVVVASLFLGTALVGWRGAAHLISAR